MVRQNCVGGVWSGAAECWVGEWGGAAELRGVGECSGAAEFCGEWSLRLFGCLRYKFDLIKTNEINILFVN